ncbi:MAG: iron dependent repressor, metal binding and dimerization domain protein, partial [Planctomycetota bacterium]
WIHYALMVLVSVTAVASFESVGSILVVAMLIVPAAAAYLLTDRLGLMVGLSLVIAVASATLGHLGAATIPLRFGFQPTTTAGMMAVVSGALFLLAALFAPRHGVLVRFVRGRLLSLRILCDDVVALLFRLEERGDGEPAAVGLIRQRLLAGSFQLQLSLWLLRRRGEVVWLADRFSLTGLGRDRGRELVRSHRLWEQYLVVEASSADDRIHQQAEKFEHFTDRQLREQLDRVTEAPTRDPHGSPIPPE